MVPNKTSEGNLALEPPVASLLTASLVGRNEGKLEKENKEAANSSHDKEDILPGKQETDALGSTPQNAPYDPEKIRQEQAATKAQAAFRGYLVSLLQK